MDRVGWARSEGAACWFGAPGLWGAVIERDRSAAGVFATSFGGKATVVLEGELDVHLGGCDDGLRVRSGEAVLCLGGTPFRHRMHAGTRLLVTDLSARRAEAGVARAALPPGLSRALARWDIDAREGRTRAVLDGLAQLSAGEAPLRVADPAAARLDRARRHLDRSFRGPVDLQALARHLGVSPRYLRRRFHAAYGLSPRAYVGHLRYERFLRSLLVRGRRRSLRALAEEVGFGDYPTFCRRIRRDLGVPPSALRAEGPKRPRVAP